MSEQDNSGNIVFEETFNKLDALQDHLDLGPEEGGQEQTFLKTARTLVDQLRAKVYTLTADDVEEEYTEVEEAGL